MEILKLENSHPAMKDFLTRRRLKYDQYDGQWFEILWTEEALKAKVDYKANIKKDKYKIDHPTKEKKPFTYYQRVKMGLNKVKKGVEVEVELNPVHLLDESIPESA